MTAAPTVFLFDEDPARLARCLWLAGFDVETLMTVDQFLAAGSDARPGCVVLDIDMPGTDGLELQRVMAERHSVMPIVFVSGRADISMVVSAMKAGASDFLAKPVLSDVLVAAVRVALQANQAHRAARSALDALMDLLATLTPRELEVLPLVAQGKLNKQIADRLGIEEKTIKVHRARVMTKLQVRTLADLVRLAERVGVNQVGHNEGMNGRRRPQ